MEDDGRGLNAEIIKHKAKSLGLLAGDGNELSEEEIFRFIFAQGFSTAEEVSDISGRGVGMSAILESVEELSGKLQITSKAGQGVKVQIEIPLPKDDLTSQRLDVAV